MNKIAYQDNLSKKSDSKYFHDSPNKQVFKQINTMCAFHSSQKITNFCRNKQCLLPLCPKCIKIHTNQHNKMGIFGQFDTIEETYEYSDKGLYSLQNKLRSYGKIVNNIKQQYQKNKNQQKKKMRQARNCLLQEVQNIFDNVQKKWQQIKDMQNNKFIQCLQQSQQLLQNLGQQCTRSIDRLKNSQSVMQGIINYHFSLQQTQKVDILIDELQNLFPKSQQIYYQSDQLQRMDQIIKRFINFGIKQEQIWNNYKYEKKKPNSNKSPQRLQYSKFQKQTNKDNSKPKIINLSKQKYKEQTIEKGKFNIESKLNLQKFKSPLDNFSLAEARRNKI